MQGVAHLAKQLRKPAILLMHHLFDARHYEMCRLSQAEAGHLSLCNVLKCVRNVAVVGKRREFFDRSSSELWKQVAGGKSCGKKPHAATARRAGTTVGKILCPARCHFGKDGARQKGRCPTLLTFARAAAARHRQSANSRTAVVSFTTRDCSMVERFLFALSVTPVTADVCRFEQSFSDDGGKNWELNRVATDTRAREPAPSTR